MQALTVNAISKSFYSKDRAKHVLDSCSLEVNEGVVFGLVGLNGIGKTTLIKIILGMLEQDSGTVQFFGNSNKNASSRKDICYLPEKFQPSQYLTGYDFLEITLSFFNQALDISLAKEMALKVDLDPSVLKYKSGSYSKGMGQKLGLMSCLMSNAKLLILDEPMSGLDPKSRVILKRTLHEYRDSGKSIFFSSHILEDISELCSDIAVIHDRGVKFRGSPEQFKEKFGSTSAERAFLNCIETLQ